MRGLLLFCILVLGITPGKNTFYATYNWLLLLVVSTNTFGQTAEDSVKQTVNNLFTAMKTSDANLLRTVFADSALLQTIVLDRNTGLASVRNQDVNGFVKQVGLMNAGDAE